MITVENREGRLIEIRSVAPVTMADAQGMFAALQRLFAGCTQRMVGCSDLRRASVVPQEITDATVAMLRSDNPRIERTALLVEGATLGLQLERIAREANHPNRKVFRDASAARAFLEPILTPAERTRLEQFLAGG